MPLISIAPFNVGEYFSPAILRPLTGIKSMNKRKIPANHFKKVKKQFPSSSIESVRSDQRNFLLPLNGGAVAFYRIQRSAVHSASTVLGRAGLLFDCKRSQAVVG